MWGKGRKVREKLQKTNFAYITILSKIGPVEHKICVKTVPKYMAHIVSISKRVLWLTLSILLLKCLLPVLLRDKS